MIASRTKKKCDELKKELEAKTTTKIQTAQVDADNVEELVQLIESYQPDAVLNVALPYQDLTIMQACLKTKVDYIDTANYEAEDTQDPEWRKVYEKRCRELGFTAYFAYFLPMHLSTILMRFIPLIFWIAMVETTDIHLQLILIRRLI